MSLIDYWHAFGIGVSVMFGAMVGKSMFVTLSAWLKRRIDS